MVLKVVLIPKPEKESYKFTIKGSGDSDNRIDFYIYNKEGDVVQNSFRSNPDGNPVYFSLESNGNDSYTITTEEESIFSHKNTLLYINYLWSNKYINKTGLFESLYKLVENSKKYYDKDNIVLSSRLLENTIQRLNVSKEDQMVDTYKSLLNINLRLLLSTVSLKQT